METMRFGGTLHRILRQVLTSGLCLVPVYLSKVYWGDAYMGLWVRMEDVPSVAFLIPNKNPRNLQLVGFNLSLPVGYLYSTPTISWQ